MIVFKQQNCLNFFIISDPKEWGLKGTTSDEKSMYRLKILPICQANFMEIW